MWSVGGLGWCGNLIKLHFVFSSFILLFFPFCFFFVSSSRGREWGLRNTSIWLLPLDNGAKGHVHGRMEAWGCSGELFVGLGKEKLIFHSGSY